MNVDIQNRTGAGKHAWREVGRVEPVKRPVADRLSDFSEVSQPYDETTASEQASRCVQCPNPNCIIACPLELPIPKLLALTAEGQFREAAELLFTTESLPEFAAHVCVGTRLCEAACVLAKPSDPVPIGGISRFLLDWGWKHGVKEPAPDPANGKRVAVIGSGLCGLVAADALSRLGYAVVILDSPEVPGGRLVNGLAGFRVDRTVIERRVQTLKERGVKYHMGVECGRDVTLGELRRGYDAVLFALGRTEAVPLEIPGAQLHGVCQAYPFILQHTSKGALRAPPVIVKDQRVVVLGGGDTAMDALRIALRAGAKEALCIYRRDWDNMPADPKELQNAVEEGGRFLFLSQPVAVMGNAEGEVAAVRCVRTELAEVEPSGRRGVRTLAGTEFEVEADVVLVAYGFAPPQLPHCDEMAQLNVDGQGCIVVDAGQMTNLEGVFAAGSIARWPVSIIGVMRDARRAATEIDRYLASRPAGS